MRRFAVNTKATKAAFAVNTKNTKAASRHRKNTKEKEGPTGV
jgi:hypothetical protein